MASILVGDPGIRAIDPDPQPGIGVVAPYDFGLDREIWRWTPDDVSLYVTRTPRLLSPMTIEMAERVSEVDIVRTATENVLAVEPGVVVYLCTSGSFVRGQDGERVLRMAMLDAGAPAAITTSGALVDALDRLAIQRLAIATPYVESVTERLADFLAESDVSVVGSAHLGLLDRIWRVPYRDVAELVTIADTPEADAVFVSCTNLTTFDMITDLEERLGKPVLTANQVTLWAAVQALEVEPPKVDQALFTKTALVP